MNIYKAEMLVKYKRNGMTYDEVITIAKEAEKYLSSMRPDDPAYLHFIRERDDHYALAQAIDIVDKLDRKDHLIELNCVVMYGCGAYLEEETLYVLKGTRPSEYTAALSSEYSAALDEKGIPFNVRRDLEIELM